MNTDMNHGDGEKHEYSVGEICSLTGVTRKTLFYYDRTGLLKPAYRHGSQEHKRYGNTEFQRLIRILDYREAGLSIGEIRKILDDPDCSRKDLFAKVLDRLIKEKAEKEKQILKVKEYIRSFDMP